MLAPAASGVDTLLISQIAAYIAIGVGVIVGIVLISSTAGTSAIGWLLLIVNGTALGLMIWNSIELGFGKSQAGRM